MAYKYAQIGDKYFVLENGQPKEQTTEQDIRGQMGDLSPATYARFGVPQGDWKKLLGTDAFSGSQGIQVLGPNTPVPSGLPFNQDFANYLKETGQTYTDGSFSGTGAKPPTTLASDSWGGSMGVNGQQGGQQGGQQFVKVRRDLQDNIYGIDANGKEHKLVNKPGDPLHAFNGGQNINASFVPAGQTVSLKMAQTGNEGESNAPSQEEQLNNLKGLGLSDATIQALGPQGANQFAALGEAIKSMYEQNYPVPQTFTDADLGRILKQASEDPNINDFYKNQLRIGNEELRRNLAYVQGDYEALQKQQQEKYLESQKEQGEQFASQGAIYSGFYNQARQKLKESESSVIESSKRTLDKGLQQLGGQYEQKYGTSNLQPISVGGITYNPLTGIPGQMEQQRLLDIRGKEQELINKEALTRGLTT